MINKTFILFLLFILPFIPLFSQNQTENLYHYYTFKEFTKNHFSDSMVFLKDVYNFIKYPAMCREKEIEGIAEILIINHSDSSFEIVNKNEYNNLFEQTIHETIKNSHALWKKTDQKFIVDFCINFILVDSNYKSSLHLCPIDVIAYPPRKERSPEEDTSYFFPSHSLDYPPQVTMNLPYGAMNQAYGNKYPGTHISGIDDLTQFIQTNLSFWAHKKIKISWISELYMQLDKDRYLEPNHKSWFWIGLDLTGHLAEIHFPQSPELEAVYPYLKLQFDNNYPRPAMINGRPVRSAFYFMLY